MKPVLPFSLLAVTLILIPRLSFADEMVWLEWIPSPESDVAVYNIYRSALFKPLPTSPEDLIAASEEPQYIDLDVLAGDHFYYWVTAVDYCGNESACCGPLAVTVGETHGDSLPDGAPDFDIEHIDENQDPADPFVNRTLDNDDVIEFCWPPFSQPGVRYRIYLSENSNPVLFQMEIDSLGYRIEGAESGQSYRLYVEVIGLDQQPKGWGFSDNIRCQIAEIEVLTPGMPSAVNVP